MKIRFCLDSGAHSLFSVETVGYDEDGNHMKGARARIARDFKYYDTERFQVYLNQYVTYVNFFKNCFEFYVTVDVITNAQRTQYVLELLEERGLKPMPVYHHGSNFDVFKKWTKKYEYIGVGGVAQGSHYRHYVEHGNMIFNYLGSTSDIRIHGFAVTAYQLITLWPWYSVDSTSPSIHARFGNLTLPQISKVNGKLNLNYTGMNNILCVSDGRSASHKHIGHLSGQTQKYLDEYLESLGTNMYIIRREHEERDALNHIWMARFIEQYAEHTGKRAPIFWKSGKHSAAPTKVPHLVQMMANAGVKEYNYMATFFRLDGLRVANKCIGSDTFYTMKMMNKAIAAGQTQRYALKPRFKLTDLSHLGGTPNDKKVVSERPKLLVKSA